MKHAVAFALSTVALVAAPAYAKTFPIPAENPIATVSIPDTWSLHDYEGGVEGSSPDGKVYIAVEQVQADDVKAATEEGVKFFAKQGVDIDFDSLKTQEGKINGLPAFDMDMAGKDKDGPTEVDLTLVGTNASDKFLMLYYWGAPDAAQANLKDLKAIADSIQATK